MEESMRLVSKVDVRQQPSAQSIQICSEPFIPFFCCFYSIICSETVEARVSLKCSLNIIPAIDCHQLNISWHDCRHCSHKNLILAKILLVSHCFQLKTKYNFAERYFDSKVLLPIFPLIFFTLLLGSIKHLICIPLVPLFRVCYCILQNYEFSNTN